ncbi:unnamed protein product [Moneuplotes crassus]|uniref:Uncharacterized protein n=1 Tax=Euplotes crassus TaxID=5936 RepID=A0AAD1UQ68_EUPCR|nr:unnamed protein product [Moneuplotes crassus]
MPPTRLLTLKLAFVSLFLIIFTLYFNDIEDEIFWSNNFLLPELTSILENKEKLKKCTLEIEGSPQISLMGMNPSAETKEYSIILGIPRERHTKPEVDQLQSPWLKSIDLKLKFLQELFFGSELSSVEKTQTAADKEFQARIEEYHQHAEENDKIIDLLINATSVSIFFNNYTEEIYLLALELVNSEESNRSILSLVQIEAEKDFKHPDEALNEKSEEENNISLLDAINPLSPELDNYLMTSFWMNDYEESNLLTMNITHNLVYSGQVFEDDFSVKFKTYCAAISDSEKVFLSYLGLSQYNIGNAQKYILENDDQITSLECRNNTVMFKLEQDKEQYRIISLKNPTIEAKSNNDWVENVYSEYSSSLKIP